MYWETLHALLVSCGSNVMFGLNTFFAFFCFESCRVCVGSGFRINYTAPGLLVIEKAVEEYLLCTSPSHLASGLFVTLGATKSDFPI